MNDGQTTQPDPPELIGGACPHCGKKVEGIYREEICSKRYAYFANDNVVFRLKNDGIVTPGHWHCYMCDNPISLPDDIEYV